MRIVTKTDERLVVECPRTGTVFLSLFIAFPGIISVVLFASADDAGGILMGLFCLIFVAFGGAGLWFGGPVQLKLDRTTELATVTRHLPHKTLVETYPLGEIDDVTNARDAESNGYGLSFELSNGKTIGIASANYHNSEARTVGKSIRTWLKTNGYR